MLRTLLALFALTLFVQAADKKTILRIHFRTKR